MYTESFAIVLRLYPSPLHFRDVGDHALRQLLQAFFILQRRMSRESPESRDGKEERE